MGGSWWTARARWALATAWRVTGEQCYLDRYVRSDPGVVTPGKVLGIQILGLLELYRVRPTAALREEIGARFDAILAHGPSHFRDRPGQKAVASWGYRQLQAVARAARLLDQLEYRLACEATVRT